MNLSLLAFAALTLPLLSVPTAPPLPEPPTPTQNSQPLGHGTVWTEITQENIYETICISGWTRLVRPTLAYTSRLKRRNLKLLPSRHSAREFELDHVIPLSLGGHPTDPRNLSLQSWPEARRKDWLERHLQREVCGKVRRHTITLDQARKEIAEAWETSRRKHIREH